MTAIGIALAICGWVVARIASTPIREEKLFGISQTSLRVAVAGLLALVAGAVILLWQLVAFAWRTLP